MWGWKNWRIECEKEIEMGSYEKEIERESYEKRSFSANVGGGDGRNG